MRNIHLIKLLHIVIIILCISFIASSNDKLPELIYNEAIKYENEGVFDEAIKKYYSYIKTIKDKKEIEKIELKIARITPKYNEAVTRYNYFIDKYDFSDYKNLARYELATMHKLAGKYNEALKEYEKLLKQGKNSSYWQKSILNIAAMQYELGEYKKAIEQLHELLQKADDYEDVGNAYYYLGKTLLKQGLYEDAEQYFLICAGSYPQSSKGAAALLDLMNVYILTGKYGQAERIATMINQLYSDSPENKKANKLILKIKDKKKDKKFPEVELINLTNDKEIKERSMKVLNEELKESLNINEILQNETNKEEVGFYLQLGYFSSYENVKITLKNYNSKNIKDIFIAKTIPSNKSNTFYRLVIGPFKNKASANERLIDLKEKHIESILLELKKEYE